MSLTRLNYHHLRYFWAVARDGNLTRTARRLHVAQSALSAQIAQLEDELGEKLFAREGRTLALTEAGKIALGYADEIFKSGTELVATLRDGREREHLLRIGALATLSRNFQESFIRPMLDEPEVRLRLVSGGLQDLLAKLSDHTVDVVLSNRPAARELGPSFRSRRIARQQVSLIGRPREARFRFPEDLEGTPLLLPGLDSDLRGAFDALCDQLELSVRVAAEVDDMAMMRLLCRDSHAVGLLPSVVVRDELSRGELEEYCVVPDLYEVFYAITVERQFQHPLLRTLLSRRADEILAMAPPARTDDR